MDLKGKVNNPVTTILLLLLVIVIILAFTTAIHSVLRDNRLGPDYYTFWHAGRALMQHENPYSQLVTERIQMGIYHGRLAQGDENQVKFAYPLFVLFPFVPFWLLEFSWSQAAWMTLGLTLLLVVFLYVFRKLPKWLLFFYLFLYQIAFGVVLGNFAVLIFAILLWMLYEILQEKPLSTGKQWVFAVLLTWMTAKPQLAGLFIVLVLLYAVHKRLWAILYGFFGLFIFQLLVSMLVLPSWPIDWFTRLFEYIGYHTTIPILVELLDLFLPGPWLQTARYIAYIFLLIGLLFIVFRWGKQKDHYLAIIAAVSAVVFLMHPTGLSYEQMILLLPIYLWVTQKKGHEPIVTGVLAFIFSYLLFFISYWTDNRWYVNKIPFLLYLVWFGYYLFRARKAERKLFHD